MSKEKLIKTRKRVQQHGEVFTPVKIVREMISLKGLDEKVRDIRATILEPSVGEGIFLTEILKIRLDILLKECSTMTEYDNKSLIALSTLYGIELLEDNAQKCVMNIYIEYVRHYDLALTKFEAKEKKNVLNSAKTIIAANIQQGNFITKLTAQGTPIVFSEWKELSCSKRQVIKVIRTEYTLEDIYNNDTNEDGMLYESHKEKERSVQLTLFDYEYENDEKDTLKKTMYKYIPCNITNVFKEEMEEYEG